MRQDGITNSLLGESGYKVDRDSASLFLLSLILLFISVRSLIYCQNKNSLKQCFPTHWRPPPHTASYGVSTQFRMNIQQNIFHKTNWLNKICTEKLKKWYSIHLSWTTLNLHHKRSHCINRKVKNAISPHTLEFLAARNGVNRYLS